MRNCLFHFRKAERTLNVNRLLDSSPSCCLNLFRVPPPLPFALWHALQFICSLYIKTVWLGHNFHPPTITFQLSFPRHPLNFTSLLHSCCMLFLCWFHLSFASVSILNTTFLTHHSSSLSYFLNFFLHFYISNIILLCCVCWKKHTLRKPIHSFGTLQIAAILTELPSKGFVSLIKAVSFSTFQPQKYFDHFRISHQILYFCLVPLSTLVILQDLSVLPQP